MKHDHYNVGDVALVINKTTGVTDSLLITRRSNDRYDAYIDRSNYTCDSGTYHEIDKLTIDSWFAYSDRLFEVLTCYV